MFLLNESTHRMLMRYHALVGHLHVPNLIARVPHETGGYLVRTNSLGFRSNLEFEKPKGNRPRILVFGDSFTAGEGCENWQRYPELLGQSLDAEVYNFGLSGSAPDQHFLLYQEFAKEIDADLIIWGISIHTIERTKLTHRPSTDRVTSKPILVPKPYFTLEEGVLILHHVPVPRARPSPESESVNEELEWGIIDSSFLQRAARCVLVRPIGRGRIERTDIDHLSPEHVEEFLDARFPANAFQQALGDGLPRGCGGAGSSLRIGCP